MEIQIPEEQRSIIEGLVDSGRFESPTDAIVEGIRLLAASEKLRDEIQVGLDQADRGMVHEHSTVFDQLKALARKAQTTAG